MEIESLFYSNLPLEIIDKIYKDLCVLKRVSNNIKAQLHNYNLFSKLIKNALNDTSLYNVEYDLLLILCNMITFINFSSLTIQINSIITNINNRPNLSVVFIKNIREREIKSRILKLWSLLTYSEQYLYLKMRFLIYYNFVKQINN